MSSLSPRVSVLMAIYNGETTVRASVESILAQSYTDFEFIIVDDGSTDTTSEILQEYAARDPRLIIISNERNLGMTKSLNNAIKVLRGIYIARMDADDIALPERLALQAQYLDDHSDYGLVGSWAVVIDERGIEIDQYQWEIEDAQIRKNMIKYNCIIHPSVMMRRNIFEAVGKYDETFRYAQDYDLFFRIIQRAKVHNLSTPLLKYRVSSFSVTGSKNFAQAWCGFRARLHAIRAGMYPLWNIVFLLRPLIGMLVPLFFKQIIKKSAL